MARQTKIVNLSLPPDIFAEVERMAKEEGKSRSQILREALIQYARRDRLWRQIYKWGEKTAEQSGIKEEKDIDRIVHQFRRERAGT